jgi:hypothetical protein
MIAPAIATTLRRGLIKTECLYVKRPCPSVHTSYSRYSSNTYLLPVYSSLKHPLQGGPLRIKHVPAEAGVAGRPRLAQGKMSPHRLCGLRWSLGLKRAPGRLCIDTQTR